jgi:hypothetical protein
MAALPETQQEVQTFIEAIGTEFPTKELGEIFIAYRQSRKTLGEETTITDLTEKMRAVLKE